MTENYGLALWRLTRLDEHMSAWSVVIDIAQVVSGFAAAAALVLTLLQVLRARADKAQDVAEKVVAWAVSQLSTTDGSESADGGVIVVNGSSEVALEVDVKTQRAITASASDSFEDDGFAGRRFALIPPGTYYLKQDQETGLWSAPTPVQTSGGAYTVTLPDSDSGAMSLVVLAPVTLRPEPKRVVLFRYSIAGEGWTRRLNGSLSKGRHSSEWESEFDKSQGTALAQPLLRRHQANTSVQQLIERLFARIAVADAKPLRGAISPVNATFSDLGVTLVRRTTRNGQGLRLYVTDDLDGPSFYISGDFKGAFPNDGFTYTDGTDARPIKLDREVFADQPRTVEHWSANLDALVDAVKAGVALHAR